MRDSLAYKVSSRTARALQRDTVSKHKETNKHKQTKMKEMPSSLLELTQLVPDGGETVGPQHRFCLSNHQEAPNGWCCL